jgi:hypothetical protein
MRAVFSAEEIAQMLTGRPFWELFWGAAPGKGLKQRSAKAFL